MSFYKGHKDVGIGAIVELGVEALYVRGAWIKNWMDWANTNAN